MVERPQTLGLGLEVRKKRETVKILKQEKQGNQVVLDVEEEYSKLAPHIKEAYNEVSKEVKIPGFRSGKIPLDVLKKYVNEDSVMDRAIQLLVADIYPNVIDSSEIKPVDYPKVEIKKLDKNSPITFNIKVDVYPEIKLGHYKGIKVKKKGTTVTDDEVEKTLDFVKKNYAKQNNIDENAVVMDDDFAKKISTAGTIAALRDLIRSNIGVEKQNDANSSMRDDITRKLSEVVEGEIPKAMIEREIDGMISDLEISLKRSKMTLESYLSAVKKDKNKLREDMDPPARIRIKAKLALEKIADKEDIKIEEEELNKELAALAQHAGKDPDEYKAEISEGALESVKDYMLKEKAIDFVISKAKLETSPPAPLLTKERGEKKES